MLTERYNDFLVNPLMQLDLPTNEPCDGAENAHRQQQRGDATSDRSSGDSVAIR
jgi:hypothetical protein